MNENAGASMQDPGSPTPAEAAAILKRSNRLQLKNHHHADIVVSMAAEGRQRRSPDDERIDSDRWSWQGRGIDGADMRDLAGPVEMGAVGFEAMEWHKNKDSKIMKRSTIGD